MDPQPSQDRALLRQYAATGDQAAFASLVRRHLDVVYSAALRHLRDRQLAEDASQTVFALLARRAGELEDGVIIAGWLVQTTRFVCLDLTRTRTSQTRVEEKTARLKPMITLPPDNFAADQSAVSSQLDDALSRLGDIDRDAIVLRYFCNETAAQVGAALGLSEAAAAKRLVRALERLRGLMSRRMTQPLSAPMLTTVLARAVSSAPTGLADRAAALPAEALKRAVSLARSMPASASTSKGVLLMAATTKTNIAIAAAVLIAMAAGSAVVYHSIARSPTDRLVVIPPKQRGPATIDLRTPQSALHSVFSAVDAADEPALLRCLYAADASDAAINKAWAAVTIANVHVNDAMQHRFGEVGLHRDGKGELWVSAQPFPASTTSLTVEPTTRPNTVLIGSNPIGWAQLVQTNNQWQLDMAQGYPHNPEMVAILNGAVARANYLIHDLESGHLRTLAEAQSQRMTCDGGILVNHMSFEPPSTAPVSGAPADSIPAPAPSARAVSSAK